MITVRNLCKSFGKVTFSGGIAEVCGFDDTRNALAGRPDEHIVRL